MSLGNVANVKMCADKCRDHPRVPSVVSMFTYGADNEFYDNDNKTISKCSNWGCQCTCMVEAKTDGTCTTKKNIGVRLFKYNSEGRDSYVIRFSICSKVEN